jgi:hypothetical protein
VKRCEKDRDGSTLSVVSKRREEGVLVESSLLCQNGLLTLHHVEKGRRPCRVETQTETRRRGFEPLSRVEMVRWARHLENKPNEGGEVVHLLALKGGRGLRVET